MKRLPTLLLVVALLALTGCERDAWHQKLTVTGKTPQAEVSASSVSAVSWRKHWIQTDGMGWSYDLTGEAVVVEVTPGHYLFALLKSTATTEYMGSVAAASIAGREGRVIDGALFDEVQDKRDRAAGVIAVPAYQYPMLVTFTDLTDPASVALVDPEDLAASFGPGVRLKSVTLEVTDEAVTEGVVAEYMRWLAQHAARARGTSQYPADADAQTLPDLRRRSLQKAQPDRALLQQTQTLVRCGRPIRQVRRHLPRLCPARIPADLVADI